MYFEICANPKMDCNCCSKDDFRNVAQTSVTDQSPFHDITHPDDQIKSRHITPVLKEISILYDCWRVPIAIVRSKSVTRVNSNKFLESPLFLLDKTNKCDAILLGLC